MTKFVLVGALLLAGCVSGGGLPMCPPGFVNPDPFVTCITPRPSPTM